MIGGKLLRLHCRCLGWLSALVFFGLLMSCSRTTVVLVPDGQGEVGEVILETMTSTRVLKRAGESMVSGTFALPPDHARVMTDTEIQEKFGATMAYEPQPAERYRLYFDEEADALSQESVEQLQLAAQVITDRQSCDINIIGHTDVSVGEELFTGPSYLRAVQVKQLLIDRGVESVCMMAFSYGNHDPLVKTGAKKVLQKNRRVEIHVW